MAPRRPSPHTLAVLNDLARDPTRWRHGYDLSAENGIASGTLYPLLMRLHERGYLESKWEQPSTEGRPPRHLYRLTSAGAAYLAAQSSPQRARARGPVEGMA
ncbi:MAG: PadR family transcriptional regulator [Armatimonadetes bacterium]|nr:MAG: PadR family transcriptional regulator [Armatimonadota bacterium]